MSENINYLPQTLILQVINYTSNYLINHPTMNDSQQYFMAFRIAQNYIIDFFFQATMFESSEIYLF